MNALTLVRPQGYSLTPQGGDLVHDILVRMNMLSMERAMWEQVWDDLTTFALPDHDRWYPGSSPTPVSYDAFARGPVSVERGRKRYDDTALRAVDRLASGMESLTTPQSDKWHGLKVTDPLAPEGSDEEKEFFERVRDFMFDVRYNAKSGFVQAHQKALRSCVSLGTGVVYMEEAMGPKAHITPVHYAFVPLSQCYLAVNQQGAYDTCYRKFTMTARQCVQRWGADAVAPNVRMWASSPAQMDKLVTIIHAVQPRSDAGKYGGKTVLDAPFQSCYVDQDNRHLIGESGFYEFPFIVYAWQPVSNIAYAQSPLMLALSDIKGLNTMRKMFFKGAQGHLDPPTASASDGVMNRPRLGPGQHNYGAVDANGRLKLQFIQPGTRPDFMKEIIEGERDVVKSAMYVDLFQILINHPAETATAVLIKANEKSELLGPAGSNIQIAMSHEVERLGGVMDRKGAFAEGAALQPPDSLRGKPWGARMTSPLDRLRKAAQGVAIQRSLQTILPLAQVDPEIMDNVDLDDTARRVMDIEGAPQTMTRRPEERDAKRAQRRQQQQVQQALEMAKTGGDAAKNIVPAMGQMAQLAGLPGQPPPTGPRPNA